MTELDGPFAATRCYPTRHTIFLPRPFLHLTPAPPPSTTSATLHTTCGGRVVLDRVGVGVTSWTTSAWMAPATYGVDYLLCQPLFLLPSITSRIRVPAFTYRSLFTKRSSCDISTLLPLYCTRCRTQHGLLRIQDFRFGFRHNGYAVATIGCA